MKKVGIILVAVVVAGVVVVGAVAFVWQKEQKDQQPIACTLEAKICPDGSAVGRTGPSCEFALCPPLNDGDGGEGILPYNSGVRGAVLLGPICPVMQNPPDPQCADKPYQTAIIVFRASNTTNAFASTQSGEDGRFEISLPPGDYVLRPAGKNPFPYCSEQTVTVEPDAYTETNISCDTGIR